ncbi:MAG: rRNA maturation RNase YbeY [Acidobacteria bacterium]|nr:rRNA maturation RNase YbeY [Acidobacteriota bacterium]MBI3663758.1 rRNA maturation RNase YbeY [Acidobacteriota bacterium]
MILNRQSRVRVALAPLDNFVRRVRQELRLNGRETAICLVTDAEMARMNKTYRGKRGPTDVLSFPADAVAAARRGGIHAGLKAGATFLGDIAIAPGVARKNAKRYERTLPNELRILILHGVLHLMGYDHETDRGQMERKERRLRRRLGLE